MELSTGSAIVVGQMGGRAGSALLAHRRGRGQKPLCAVSIEENAVSSMPVARSLP